jgi:hypothetical protein
MRLLLNLPADQENFLRDQARADGRSLTSFCSRIIIAWIKEAHSVEHLKTSAKKWADPNWTPPGLQVVEENTPLSPPPWGAPTGGKVG